MNTQTEPSVSAESLVRENVHGRLAAIPQELLPELAACAASKTDTARFRCDPTGYVRVRGRGGKALGYAADVLAGCERLGVLPQQPTPPPPVPNRRWRVAATGLFLVLPLVALFFLRNGRSTPLEQGEQVEQTQSRPVTQQEQQEQGEQGEQQQRPVAPSAIPAAANLEPLTEPKPLTNAKIGLQVSAIGDALILGQPRELTEPTETGWVPVSPESLSPMARRTLEVFVAGLATSPDYESRVTFRAVMSRGAVGTVEARESSGTTAIRIASSNPSALYTMAFLVAKNFQAMSEVSIDISTAPLLAAAENGDGPRLNFVSAGTRGQVFTTSTHLLFYIQPAQTR